MSVRLFRRTPRGWVGVLATGLLAAALAVPVPAAAEPPGDPRPSDPRPTATGAQPSATDSSAGLPGAQPGVPTAGGPLPVAVDAASPYEGQKVCDPTDTEGAKGLRDLLLTTYGAATIGLSRACSGSVSEHYDGRALDWMRSTRVPEQSAQVQTFLSWLLAPAPDGTPQEMARRLGIMYLIWDNRMIRMYEPERGWTDYRNCLTAAKSSVGLDTSCHRDHLHVSMSWAGANLQTSWWLARSSTSSGQSAGAGESAGTGQSPAADPRAAAPAGSGRPGDPTDQAADPTGADQPGAVPATLPTGPTADPAQLAPPTHLVVRSAGDDLVVTWQAPDNVSGWLVTGYGMTVRAGRVDGPLVGSCTATPRARVCFAGDQPDGGELWVAVAALTHFGPGQIARITTKLD